MATAGADEDQWSPQGMAKCSYGANCYRKSAEHFETYAHPRGLLERRVSSVEKEEAAEHSVDAAAPTSSAATLHLPAADLQPAGVASCRDVVPVFGVPAAQVLAGSSMSLKDPASAEGKSSRSSTGGDTRIDPVVLDSDDEEDQVKTEGIGD